MRKLILNCFLLTLGLQSPLCGQVSDFVKEKDRIQALTAVAEKMAPGPERDALLKVIQSSLDELDLKVKAEEKALKEITAGGYLGMVNVEKTGNWALAEIKKPYLADMLEETITLKDGRIVKRESVTTLSPSGLKWIGDKLEETYWLNLPDKLVTSYGWTKDRQTAYEAWKSGANREALKAVNAEREKAMETQNASVARAKIEGTRVAVSLRVNQALPDGCLCYGTRIESSPSWSGWVGLTWVEGVPPAQEHDEPIYVMGLPATTVDGDKLAGWLYPCGVYRYTAVSGAAKSVRRYATSAKMAADYLASQNGKP